MEQAGACLTKESDADEAPTGIRALSKDVKLLGQLFTVATGLLGFSSQACHEVGGHSRDSDRSEDVAERGDELRLDYFDGDVVDETF